MYSCCLQDQPLHMLFSRAQELFAQAELGSEPAAAGARDLLDQCGVAVDRLAIFSGCELCGTRNSQGSSVCEEPPVHRCMFQLSSAMAGSTKAAHRLLRNFVA
jgi:hypothetical protein